MKWSFSKRFERMVELCFPKHCTVLFTVLKKFFVWMLCNHVKTFKIMAGLRSPTSSDTVQLILRRWRTVSFWCYAVFEQDSNERLVVLPQKRCSSFHGVERVFFWMVWNFPKTFERKARPYSPKHGPVPFTLLSFFFVWMLCSQIKTFKSMAWPRTPSSPVTAQFISRRRNLFGLMLCRFSTTFKWTAGRAPRNTVQLILQSWRSFSSWWYEAFQQHSNLGLGRVHPNMAQFLSRCWKTFSSGCYAAN